MGSESKRAITAVVLSGIILFGWQYFFGVDQMAANLPVKTTEEVIVNNKVSDSSSATITKPAVAKDIVDQANVSQNVKLEGHGFSYSIDNFLNITNASADNTSKDLISTFETIKNGPLFKFNTNYLPLSFNLVSVSPTSVKFTNSEKDVSGSIELDDKGFILFNIVSSNSFKTKFHFESNPQTNENNQIKEYIYLTEDLNTLSVGDEEKGDEKISWVGLSYNYHAFYYVLEQNQNYLFRANEEGELDVRQTKVLKNLSYKVFFSKKGYDYLMKKEDKLHLSVDFGIWSIIAVPILRGLQFFYTIFPNYGISIILLTFLIRMAMFPLQYKSFKSMKKMAEVQPQLTEIKERYKNDPQKVQQETMALFKRAGANPLGGCLPMIAQMPVFFAFYKVLYTAVELVDAPFYFWITDLSTKDPYYVLPALMALVMFFNQKITPMTTTDPMQKKLMTFMPLLFAVFMKDLPAGLSLYICISTLVGMLQQILVFKRK